MNKKFAFGFVIGFCLFLLLNGISAHLSSDCGLPAVFGLDSCADDISRAGFPINFYEDGGFAYRHEFVFPNLIVDLVVGVLLAGGFGWWFARRVK
jgi:hypothetical protein